jgi:hypothetical protein
MEALQTSSVSNGRQAAQSLRVGCFVVDDIRRKC